MLIEGRRLMLRVPFFLAHFGRNSSHTWTIIIRITHIGSQKQSLK